MREIDWYLLVVLVLKGKLLVFGEILVCVNRIRFVLMVIWFSLYIFKIERLFFCLVLTG